MHVETNFRWVLSHCGKSQGREPIRAEPCPWPAKDLQMDGPQTEAERAADGPLGRLRSKLRSRAEINVPFCGHCRGMIT